MRAIDAKIRAQNHYIHSDYSMNLNPDMGRVDNNNGVLYLGVYLELLEQCGLLTDSDMQGAVQAIAQLRIKDCPGLYKKQSDNSEYINSHDNYRALAALGEARRICEWGMAHGWTFDNTQQDTPPMKAYRQLGEVAVYKIEAGFIPTWVELAWLCGGLIVAAMTNRGPSHHLGWYLVQRLRRSIIKTLPRKAWLVTNVSLIFACFGFDLLMMTRFKSRWAGVINYYADETHPNRLLAKVLEDKERARL